MRINIQSPNLQQLLINESNETGKSIAELNAMILSEYFKKDKE